jgi:hypothetical protein
MQLFPHHSFSSGDTGARAIPGSIENSDVMREEFKIHEIPVTKKA